MILRVAITAVAQSKGETMHTTSLKRLGLYLGLLGVAALALAPAGTADRRLDLRPAEGAALDLPSLAGTWAGTWEDTRYFVQDDFAITFVVNGSSVTATTAIGLSPWAMGEKTGAGAGTIAGNTLQYTFHADEVSDGSGTITDAVIVGVGEIIAPLSYGDYDYTGTISGNTITIDFDFVSPSGGEGVITLTRAVPNETASWGEMKSAWR